MPNAQTPNSGENVQLELLVGGVPVQVVGDVLNFSCTAQYQTIETRPLGSTEVKLKKIPDGWSGELEIARRNPDLDLMIDALNLAVRNRTPTLVNISQTVFYADGTSSRYIYPDVVLDFSFSARRGDNITTRIPWRCGKERI